MKTTDKIYQNALEINSMSLQIIAWINEMRSKQDQIVAIPTRRTPQPREDSAIAEIADCQLNNNFQDFLKMQNEEIMKRKYGKGSYIKRFKRRKDGSIYTYYQGSFILDGKRICLTAKTQKQMIEKLDELYKQKTTSITKHSTETLKTYSENYAQRKTSTMTERSAIEWKRQLNSIISVLGEKPINAITVVDIENFLIMQSAGRKTKFYDVLNGIFEDAIRHDIITVNPVKKTDRPKIIQKHKYRAYEFSEQNTMIHSLPEKYARLFVFLCCTGLRISECLALASEDIKPNYIHVTKIKDSTTNEIFYQTKNGEERKVIYHESLRPYINVEFWQSLTHRKVSRQFQPIYSQFKNVNLHSTRHTYASLAHFVGIDDKIIQNQLGHKTLAMTQDTYTNIMIPGESIILSYFEKLKEIIRFTR